MPAGKGRDCGLGVADLLRCEISLLGTFLSRTHCKTFAHAVWFWGTSAFEWCVWGIGFVSLTIFVTSFGLNAIDDG